MFINLIAFLSFIENNSVLWHNFLGMVLNVWSIELTFLRLNI
jgi:hypothetical protein